MPSSSFDHVAVRTLKHVLTQARVKAWNLSGAQSGPGLRVFLYHRVAEDSDPLALSPARFREHMEILAGRECEVLDVVAALDRLHDGSLAPGTVALTFDDGFKDIDDVVQPILTAHGFKATVFVSTDVISGRARYPWLRREVPVLAWDDIRRLEAGGSILFEPHSLSHPDLRRLPADAARHEVEGSKVALEEELGRLSSAFCFPGGLAAERDFELVREAGFRYAITCEPGINTADGDPFFVRRVQVDKTDGAHEFEAKSRGSHDRPLRGRTAYRRLRHAFGR